MKNWRNKHQSLNKAMKKKTYLKLKLKVLAHYSGTNPPQCANPFGEHEKPYTTLEALSIDHINGGGNEHRRNETGYGSRLYYWLIKRNFPEGYQVLCMNCQFVKKAKMNEV